MPTPLAGAIVSSATATACCSCSSHPIATRYHQKVMAKVTSQSSTSETKPPIYLLDSMAFIFRAYHAMQRQRPMSTRTGIPTAATYVFVNMINKLRKDFSPHYLAAVYDLSGPVFRDERAREMKAVKKFNIKTQQFEEIDYLGYKANRTEMPADLTQQLPFIRRALEAFRIPILSYEGFEADDVIGTLSCKLAEAGHKVFVVSSDKDMMQLVNDSVVILNPTKDNLILDSAKVEETLGVPPTRVIDVMALRGDAIDNIPGAPGIGDKGSVDLIQRFGSVEQALDRAAEVEKKTYRESLQNNRENILLSKQLVTIDCAVPIELDVTAMQVGEPDAEALRALFMELEFTSLLKELLPVAEVAEAHYSEAKSVADVHVLLRPKSTFALAIEKEEKSDEEAEEESEPVSETLQLNLTDADPTPARPRNIAISTTAGEAITIASENAAAFDRLKSILSAETQPKAIHDAKAAMHIFQQQGIALRGLRHDPMLYSFLLDPT